MYIAYVLTCLSSLLAFVKSVPPSACFEPFNWQDCGRAPVHVLYYYKPGSRCEVGIWRGCYPNLNMFKDEYECVNTCIFVERAQSEDFHSHALPEPGDKEKPKEVENEGEVDVEVTTEGFEEEESEYAESVNVDKTDEEKQRLKGPKNLAFKKRPGKKRHTKRDPVKKKSAKNKQKQDLKQKNEEDNNTTGIAQNNNKTEHVEKKKKNIVQRKRNNQQIQKQLKPLFRQNQKRSKKIHTSTVSRLNILLIFTISIGVVLPSKIIQFRFLKPS